MDFALLTPFNPSFIKGFKWSFLYLRKKRSFFQHSYTKKYLEYIYNAK